MRNLPCPGHSNAADRAPWQPAHGSTGVAVAFQWYDQQEAEWVVVLKGEAKLLFQGDAQPIHLKPGDHVTIPAHRRHRVEWTTPNEPTVWLAVF
jgi:mannose-6-phosphate isomerase-like protein (cupin superfamily)